MPTKLPLSNLGFHLVIYVDLLGQTNELEKFRRLPTNEAEKKAVAEAINRTAGRVHLVRSILKDLIMEVAKRPPSETVLAQLPNDEARASFKRARAFEVNQIGFSDCFVTSVFLHDKGEAEGNSRVAATVYAALQGTAAAALLAAANKIPMRGGVAIGTAVSLYDNEVYGPALVDAYQLESKIAEYNRVVVSPTVFDFLNYLEALPQDTAFGQGARERARECRELLICRAPDDELPMLHMLSPEVLNLPTSTPGESWGGSLCKPAYEWARVEAQRFADERNLTMWSRYVRLLRYFDTYMPKPQ
jgi:hypothetical protein